uniref:Uncharacterized protein n=1 Tax=Nannospalax galili TaxID=1026970 RepID=A0A8C6QEW2_NANGA
KLRSLENQLYTCTQQPL